MSEFEFVRKDNPGIDCVFRCDCGSSNISYNKNQSGNGGYFAMCGGCFAPIPLVEISGLVWIMREEDYDGGLTAWDVINNKGEVLVKYEVDECRNGILRG